MTKINNSSIKLFLMKKIFTLILLFSFCIGFSQNDESETEEQPTAQQLSKNELSIGALNLIAFGAIDLAYERVINANSSWSGELFIQALNKDSEDVAEAYDKDFSLTGKYKHFFSSGYAKGFYVEGFGMFSSGAYEYDYYYSPDPNIQRESFNRNYTDFALGFGVGGKFVSSGGFMLDLSTGLGRNLFSDNSPTIVGQFNVNLGFRF